MGIDSKMDCQKAQPVDANLLNSQIEQLMDEIRDRLVVALEEFDDVGEWFAEILDKRQTETVVNGSLNENPGRAIHEVLLEYRFTGKYVKFADFKLLRDLFFRCPACYLDGNVFVDQYVNFIDGYRGDLRRSIQRRMRTLYGTFLDDILYYVVTRDLDELVMKRVQLAIEFLMKRLGLKPEPKIEEGE